MLLGKDKDIKELLDDSMKLKNDSYSEKVKLILQKKNKRFEEKLEKIQKYSQISFSAGPRDYQKEAYEKWKQNNYTGVFAMATGTGKTITSLIVS